MVTHDVLTAAPRLAVAGAVGAVSLAVGLVAALEGFDPTEVVAYGAGATVYLTLAWKVWSDARATDEATVTRRETIAALTKERDEARAVRSAWQQEIEDLRVAVAVAEVKLETQAAEIERLRRDG